MNQHFKTIIACNGANALLEAANVTRGAAGVLLFPQSTGEWKSAIAAVARQKHYSRAR